MAVVTDKNVVRPSHGLEFDILQSGPTGNSGWVDLSSFSAWTLFARNLELGSVVKIEVTNNVAQPPNNANGAILVAAQAPDTNGCFSFSSLAPFHWVRLTKTQGGTPTVSVATLHGIY
jgi:hypothetical protein